MIAKTISSVALKALTGSGDTTNQPVVNNNITINNGSPPEDDCKFVEPNPYSDIQPTSINPEFTIQFNKMVVHLLTMNDYKLLGNIIDQSKRILFTVEELKYVISLFLGCPAGDVYVNLMPPEPAGGCFCKAVTMFQGVENIKIKSRDFKMMYNGAYNTLKDDYHVCMDRVLL